MQDKSANTRMLLIILVLLTFAAGCQKEHCLDCFKGTGQKTTEQRTLGDFSSIELFDHINLYLISDSLNTVTIEGGANIIPYVLTEITDGKLTIRDENRCNWVRNFKKEINVFLHYKNLSKLEYRGSGIIQSMDTLVSDSLELNFWDGSASINMAVKCCTLRVHQHTGCGDAEISGSAHYAYYYNRGNGQLRNRGLIASIVEIDAKCTNDSYVYATDALVARIGYIGNVYYAGRPTSIETKITERGRLIPLE